MEEYLKSLEGITQREWGIVKMLIDNKLEKEKQKNTFKCDENVLKEMKTIERLSSVVAAQE